MTKKMMIFGLVIGLIVVVIWVGLSQWNKAVQSSFPQIEGELNLAGLQTKARVVRDEMGIPHIYADNLHDLFFAQGYVHAQDRFWQMDFWRHIGMGRLSEMFGESQADTDKFLLTLEWEELAYEELDQLQPESIAILQAYSEGVNAYLGGKSGTEVSIEYLVLKVLNPDYEIAPWQPTHTLTWAKAMAWDLRGNMEEEIERAILLNTLNLDQVNQLYPPYPGDHPQVAADFKLEIAPQASSGLGDLASISKQIEVQTLLTQITQNKNGMDQVLGEFSKSVGSNNWVIDGTLSETGKPLLANDPHLSIQMPSIWYQLSLHCQPRSDECPYEVAGFSFAGVPGVVIGHNDRIAWAFTNTGPDVMDLFVEKINPSNPNQYEYKGEWVDMEIVEEEFDFGNAKPESFVIRKTIHGPIISDVFGPLKDDVEPTQTPFSEQAGIELPENYAIALKWTALEPGSVFEAIWGFNKAQNWDEFRIAASKFVVPAQNLLYADVEGNIGYQMPGNIPVRRNGDGRLPVPGWTGEYDWSGYIPFEQLPNVFNPESGYIITANNQVITESYPYLITSDWDYGYRAQRIEDMLLSKQSGFKIEDFRSMQSDDINLNSYAVIEALENVELTADLAKIRDEILLKWDHRENKSAGAALYEAYWWELVKLTFEDEDIPEDMLPSGGSRTNEIFRILINDPKSLWWDDKRTTEKVEMMEDIMAQAFLNATQCEICIEKFGKDIQNWDWSELHTATFKNATLGESGIGFIEAIFNRGPFPTTGGESIVNATGWDIYESFEVNWLPSMRMIIDLSNLERSITVHTTGQSGHADHLHYDDMIPLWADLEYYPMYWLDESIKTNSEGELILNPLK